MKKYIIFFIIIMFNITTASAKCTVTGGACSIEDLNRNSKNNVKTEKTTTKTNHLKFQEKKLKNKKDKSKGGKFIPPNQNF